MKISIINSKGHWINGWAVSPNVLKTIVDLLEKNDIFVSVTEVASLKELQNVLEHTDSNSLIWPNGYLVNDGAKGVTDLVYWIEKYQLPLVGSGYNTLQQLLHKDICQTKMQKAGIPVPPHRVIEGQQLTDLSQISLNGALTFPLVIKPSKESRSNGVERVDSRETALSSIEAIFKNFPDNNVLIEAFMPGDDITCGYFQLGDKRMLLPSYCAIEGLDCKEGIYSAYHYTLPHTIETHPRVEDQAMLAQLEEYVPRIVELFDIKGTTRIDARSDRKGKLHFFDVNGMPGLNFPSSAVIKQAKTHFPQYPTAYLFECLLHTIIGESLLRYNMPLPEVIEKHNLFNLESQTIIDISKS